MNVSSTNGRTGNGTVRVTKHGAWLTLRFGDTEQGLAYVGAPDEPGWAGGAAIPGVLSFEYLRVMAAAAAAFSRLGRPPGPPQPPRVLCVGLGAGCLPSFWAWHDRNAAVQARPLAARAAIRRAGSRI